MTRLPDGENPLVDPRVFISHSAEDYDLAEALTELLNEQFNTTPEMIRCTSVTPYELPPGEDANTALREDLRSTELVIGLVTPNSIKSSWVLFELGAAWVKKKKIFPLLARGTTASELPATTRNLQALKLTDARAVHKLLGNITVFGERREGKEGAVHKKVETLVKTAKLPTQPSNAQNTTSTAAFDNLQERFRRAKETIHILQTWIPGLPTYETSLMEAASRKVDIKVLLVHPHSTHTIARATELGYTSPDAVSKRILGNLADFTRISQHNRDTRQSLKVRLYTGTPTILLYQTDESALMHPFLRGAHAHAAHAISEIEDANAALNAHFASIWETALPYSLPEGELPPISDIDGFWFNEAKTGGKSHFTLMKIETQHDGPRIEGTNFDESGVKLGTFESKSSSYKQDDLWYSYVWNRLDKGFEVQGCGNIKFETSSETLRRKIRSSDFIEEGSDRFSVEGIRIGAEDRDRFDETESLEETIREFRRRLPRSAKGSGQM